jgi:hypothetical protein
MRIFHLALWASVGLAAAGCYTSPSPTKPNFGDGRKLKEAIVGKWVNADNGKTVFYEFNKDGNFKYDSDQLKYAGIWKAVNDKFIEISYDLNDEQLAGAKKEWDDAMKQRREDFGTPEKRRPPLPPPEKSNANLQFQVEIDGDELTMEFHKYKKAK